MEIFIDSGDPKEIARHRRSGLIRAVRAMVSAWEAQYGSATWLDFHARGPQAAAV